METTDKIKNAATLKEYSENIQDKEAYKIIKSACSNYVPFTHGGLNALPYMFLPAIAEVMEEYAESKNAELKNALRSLQLSIGAHPDNIPDSEFRDMVRLAERALNEPAP